MSRRMITTRPFNDKQEKRDGHDNRGTRSGVTVAYRDGRVTVGAAGWNEIAIPADRPLRNWGQDLGGTLGGAPPRPRS